MWKVVIFTAFLALAVTGSPEENIGINDPDTVEGDILLTSEEKAAYFGGRAALRRNLWPNAVVPYEIHETLAKPHIISEIEAAMGIWQSLTCIRFVKRTTESAYLEIFKGNGCSSFVGTIHSKQRLNLGAGCLTPRVILHELGHALGFHHEHNRPDRDDYVTIMWENITPNYRFAFNKKSPYEVTDLGTPYDYNSIMHYHRYAFSMSGNPTIIVKQSALIGSNKLSEIDIYQMNRLYKCPGVTEWPFTTMPPPSSEFSCNFDSGSCGFIQVPNDEDNLDWISLNKATPSGDTGPNADHTTGAGNYMFVEASGGRKGSFATMKKTVILSGRSCLTFFYHMYGHHMGTLQVFVRGNKVFEKTGDQGKVWHKAELKLQGTGMSELEFRGIVSGHFQSDMAIDDVSMSNCGPTIAPMTPPTTSAPETTSAPPTTLATTAVPSPPPEKGFSCNFESDLCGFTQETSDDYNWTRSNKKTPTWDSGPDTDHTSGTGFYLYTEASGRKPGNRAVLSRSIPLTGNTCLTFYYHMHGSEMGSLSVNVGGKKVFEKSGPQGKSWTKATINLQGQGQAKLEFVGMIGSGFKSDAGIDDIIVGECQ
ncbi:MAM and LDL-receptor class A domain-containing protein 1 isoform X2 [Nematostella vectensis]|uniref:MAM and LDL-receptor class A domain-containing protein 1 isoform X2 n=1 Tax=Nematostella vectensis TaxID=45351 RepID=UPI0020778D33|nr:MAM and LDL-receptor class A domain-containing protein 1 isoform X2 [Nematostella vectensis]